MNLDDLTHFLNEERRLLSWPAKPRIQIAALCYLAGKLEWNRFYTEQELNNLLNQWHLLSDAALLRRELYTKCFLDRKRDGSAYWKMPRLLPAIWKTQRLTIRDAEERDLPELRAVLGECAYVDELTGFREEVADPTLREFRGESLPPNGKKGLQRFQAILETTSGVIVGHLITYHGFPDADTFWIGSFMIRPAFQRQKFGKEVMDALAILVEELGTYSAMGIGVLVGNEVGMKFWESCGFTNLVKTDDHGTHVTKWIMKEIGV